MSSVLAANPLIEVMPGLMIWTILCFLVTFFVLKKFAFGAIQKIIDERRQRIREALAEADQRARRGAEDARGAPRDDGPGPRPGRGDPRRGAAEWPSRRRSGCATSSRSTGSAGSRRRERQIEAETQRALALIRAEVADLTVIATQKVTGKVLDEQDHKRLIEDAIRELDFSVLEGSP